MTINEINTLIALECGWVKCSCNDDHCSVMFPPGSNNPKLGPPNYMGDLNATYEMEEEIKRRKKTFYYGLCLGRNGGNNYEWTKIHAKPSERVMAFLKTIGKPLCQKAKAKAKAKAKSKAKLNVSLNTVGIQNQSGQTAGSSVNVGSANQGNINLSTLMSILSTS